MRRYLTREWHCPFSGECFACSPGTPVSVCSACGQGAMRANGEDIAVPPEVIDQADCDAQVVELDKRPQVGRAPRATPAESGVSALQLDSAAQTTAQRALLARFDSVIRAHAAARSVEAAAVVVAGSEPH